MKRVYFRFQFKPDTEMGSIPATIKTTKDRKEAYKIWAALKRKEEIDIVKVTTEVINERKEQ